MEQYLDLWYEEYLKLDNLVPPPKITPKHFIKQPDWIWRSGCFAGEFGDAFIVNTNLEGGDVPASIETLVRLLFPLVKNTDLSSHLLSLFTKDSISTLETIFNDFITGIIWGRQLFETRGDPSRFLTFLTDWIHAVRDLPIGKRLIINGGWLVAYRSHKRKYYLT